MTQKAPSSRGSAYLTFAPPLLLALAMGCGTAASPPRPTEPAAAPKVAAAPPATATAAEKEPPPSSGPPRAFRFPRPAWNELSNGLKIATVPNHTLPLLQIQVVVLSGKSADGERPGVAALTGALLKDGGSGAMTGRELVTRIESLGANLSIDTDFDSTALSLAITKDHLAEALDLLGTIVQKPQFNAAEFGKRKKLNMDRAADLGRTSGQWAASMVLYRDLFSLPAEQHPYAAYDATAADLARITVNDCRALHRRLFVPKNTFIVVSGDTTPEAVKEATEKAFGGYRGPEPPVITFTDPLPPESLKITLVDRPKSSQSDVFVGVLGPERADKDWAAFAVVNQVLGGFGAGRLFSDVREKQSLAYRARSSLFEFAHGPSLLITYAGTQTAKTGLSLKALLENLERLGQTAADEEEVASARRYLADVFAIRMETVRAVADEVVRLRLLGLPDDYNDTYRKELGEVSPALALKSAGGSLRSGHMVVVVSGDAQTIGGMLSHFGEVKVVDPARNFERVRTIPMNAAAPLESAREAGK